MSSVAGCTWAGKLQDAAPPKGETPFILKGQEVAPPRRGGLDGVAELSVEQPSASDRQGKPSHSTRSVSGEARRSTLCWLRTDGCAATRTEKHADTTRLKLQRRPGS